MFSSTSTDPYVSATGEKENESLLSPSAPAMKAALNELEKRWRLWNAGINVRSFMCDEGFVSVVVSAAHCDAVCYPVKASSSSDAQPFSFIPMKSVLLEGHMYTVLGATNHRIWFQKQSTGKIVGHSALYLSQTLGFELNSTTHT